MTYTDLIKNISIQTGIKKESVKNVVDTTQHIIFEKIKNKEDVRLNILGVIKTQSTPSRTTILKGVKYNVPESVAVKINLNKNLKQSLKR